MSSPTTGCSARENYAAAVGKIRQEFEASGDGRAAVQARTRLVDSISIELFREFLAPAAAPQLSLVAMGGYGRGELFPCSDIDLLFLCADRVTEEAYKQAIKRMCQEMWDLRLRVSPATRTLAECEQLHRDNVEFNISLLDCRYLTGDEMLFARLRDQSIPQMVIRDRQELVRNLADVTSQRHSKYGHTIFHLEPNLKETPGGLRDYNVACWLALIWQLEKHRGWPNHAIVLPEPMRQECARALGFLSAARCFLHYRHGRDDNGLTYELQAEAAERGIGVQHGHPMDASEWMRAYFRHARSIDRVATLLLEEVPPARSGLYKRFESWRTRLSNADFSVVQGRVFIRQPDALKDPAVMLRLFEYLARHGLKLSAEAERYIDLALAAISDWAPRLPELWPTLRQVLVLPHAADALRAMHRTGVLVRMFPEFQAIDSLVIRDYYHRYTVDEHSFTAIQNLHSLPKAEGELQRRFAQVLSEVEQPELLFLTLICHDIGKGGPSESHIAGSVEAAEGICARLALDPTERDSVRFLISSHLEMSATLQRRDIFDPEVVRAFAESVGTAQRLRMLCLLTYADIGAVSPEALTPWKAETLWQLYAATDNHLSRSLDDQRIADEAAEVRHVESIVPLVQDATPEQVLAFLKGFPKRYLLTHSPKAIAEHFRLAGQLSERDPVQLRFVQRPHLNVLTVITADRPGLFATIAGILSAWGMNIIKADAFANNAGMILDTFRFVDLYRTLELNPSEIERFKRSIVEVLAGDVSLQTLMYGRMKASARRPVKIGVETQVRFLNEPSSHSTLVELIAQDRPGLLYQVCSRIAELECNIEVALVDTEGQKAIDVFYLTRRGKKLTAKRQQTLREAMLQQLSS
ncbi:MAG: [protein-PII] uridylyltransferase [Terriglobales bacterium]